MSQNQFYLVSAILWAGVGTYAYLQRRKFNQEYAVLGTDTKTGDYTPVEGFNQAAWMRPYLPWATIGFALNSLLQFARPGVAGIFAGVASTAAGLLCIFIYISLVENARGQWRPSTFKTVLLVLFFLLIMVGVFGYIIASGSYK